MIEFTKKNIKGIIDILKSDATRDRIALQTMRIKRDGFAYITNGYLAIRWKFEIEPIPSDDNQLEFVIPLDNLIRWYKLANSTDTLNELTILDLQDKDNNTQYPEIDKLFNLSPSLDPSCEDIDVDLHLLEQVYHCINGTNYDGVNIKLYATKKIYGKVLKHEKIDFLIMGLNIN